ncbi:DNA polymerase III alpha subunit [Lachnospiraceae bacterium]|nr:DNA polymerase III alpha subunit [Lachnospiraceae bacterium]
MLIFRTYCCSDDKIDFNCPEGHDPFSYLKELSFEGAYKKYSGCNEYIEKRLNHEIEVIHHYGLTDFFLVLWDCIRYAKSQGIFVGPGRGPLPSSMVSYCLDITQLDPMKYDLLFERFLPNNYKGEKEEFLDFDPYRQNEVYDYAIQKYNSNPNSLEITVSQDESLFAVIPSLRLICRTLQIIYKERGQALDLYNIDFTDKNVFDVIGNDFIDDFFIKMSPRSLEELTSGYILHPESDNIWSHKETFDLYIENRRQPAQKYFVNGIYNDIIKTTHGLLIYQEQIIAVLKRIGGFSPEQSNEARRALGRRDTALIKDIRNKFIYGSEKDGISGCISRGITEDEGNSIFTIMEKMAIYAGNKSHFMSYSMLIYQKAWLNYYYPDEYKTAFSEVCNQHKVRCS